VSASKPITFDRKLPTEHVLLIARVGFRTGEVVVGTAHLKPPGTEYATEGDLRDAGYVPEAWREIAVRAYGALVEALEAPAYLEPADGDALLRRAVDGMPEAVKAELAGALSAQG
jgi:hypothetical protein